MVGFCSFCFLNLSISLEEAGVKKEIGLVNCCCFSISPRCKK